MAPRPNVASQRYVCVAHRNRRRRVSRADVDETNPRWVDVQQPTQGWISNGRAATTAISHTESIGDFSAELPPALAVRPNFSARVHAHVSKAQRLSNARTHH